MLCSPSSIKQAFALIFEVSLCKVIKLFFCEQILLCGRRVCGGCSNFYRSSSGGGEQDHHGNIKTVPFAILAGFPVRAPVPDKKEGTKQEIEQLNIGGTKCMDKIDRGEMAPCKFGKVAGWDRFQQRAQAHHNSNRQYCHNCLQNDRIDCILGKYVADHREKGG